MISRRIAALGSLLGLNPGMTGERFNNGMKIQKGILHFLWHVIVLACLLDVGTCRVDRSTYCRGLVCGCHVLNVGHLA